jgi:TusA-related sulfurtransferase
MERQPAHIINVSGEFSPFTLLKISQIFREMAAGDILEIRQCDPETRSDLVRILSPDTCRLVIDDENGDNGNGDDGNGGKETGEEGGEICRIRLLKTAIVQ